MKKLSKILIIVSFLASGFAAVVHSYGSEREVGANCKGSGRRCKNILSTESEQCSKC